MFLVYFLAYSAVCVCFLCVCIEHTCAYITHVCMGSGSSVGSMFLHICACACRNASTLTSVSELRTLLSEQLDVCHTILQSLRVLLLSISMGIPYFEIRAQVTFEGRLRPQ